MVCKGLEGGGGYVRVGAGGLEDVQHAGAGEVPDVRAELLSVHDHQVLQAISPRTSKLLVLWGGGGGKREINNVIETNGRQKEREQAGSLVLTTFSDIFMMLVLLCII